MTATRAGASGSTGSPRSNCPTNMRRPAWSRWSNSPPRPCSNERARAANADFRLDARSAPLVVDICRKLDGIPLAIELAAARIDTMTPQAIADALDDRFALLTRGRRTALPRHGSLRGALDWSYVLLAVPLQQLLDRLALFAAISISTMRRPWRQVRHRPVPRPTRCSPNSSPSRSSSRPHRPVDALPVAGLPRGIMGRNGCARPVLPNRRTAITHMCCCAGWPTVPPPGRAKAPREWLGRIQRALDDVRSAIAWAGGGKDASLAAELVIAAAPLWFHLSLPAEFLRYAEGVIATWRRGAVEPRGRSNC